MDRGNEREGDEILVELEKKQAELASIVRPVALILQCSVAIVWVGACVCICVCVCADGVQP